MSRRPSRWACRRTCSWAPRRCGAIWWRWGCCERGVCPLPNPPPLTRERGLPLFLCRISATILPPLPRSGGGMGRGPRR
ncbi:hypothetical protein A6A40_14735 [Azospirillum humicireducens]|uniref:Uncharacterized protein n=1 Tax=Azospirillum humicireducens TaxID=1226968 RepID=A0A2R4VPL2_9PROT|nr:hypothetical protein A6A40_14735 [Azospirillum humicireducens]